MSCGVSPNYAHCAMDCELNTNGGSFGTLAGLLDYCTLSSGGGVEKNCVVYYFSCTNLGYPPSSSSQYSSTSSECSEGNNDFNFENVKNGFRDYYEFFFLLFACFCLVKLLNMAK